MKNWFSIKNKSNGVLDISIHDEIGLWGISAKDFISELRSHQDVKVINLSIHSPGGSVLDGLAMYNALTGHSANIYTHVEGIAASAASFVLMAGDTITMPEDAFIMIHNAWGFAMGDADEMRDTADLVDKLQDSIVNIYEKRTGRTQDELREMMKAETWMNAEEALSMGFIDTISDAVGVAAKATCFEQYFKSLPFDADPEQPKIDAIDSIKDFSTYLRNAGGLSRKAADALTARAKAIFQVSEETDAETAEKLSEALNRVQSRLTV